MKEAVIVSGARTAVGEFGGSLKGIRVVDMGARITYTLAMQMKKKNLKPGLASLCIGGGQGMSLVLERA